MPSIQSISAFVALLAVGMAPAVSQAQPLSADVINKARENCLTAVARTVNKPRSSLKIIGSTSDSSGAKVSIKVPTAQAPWACLTSPRGDVEDVYFNG